MSKIKSSFEETDIRVKILMPAFNEESIIQQSIELLRTVDSDERLPDLQFILVDDGSTDSTFQIMNDELGLIEVEIEPRYPNVPSEPVTNTYRSADGKFLVVRKVNGGRADALNAGIVYCDSDVVLITDADCFFSSSTVLRILNHFHNDEELVALGGNLRLINEQSIEKLNLNLNLPNNWLAKFQTIEYFRSFVSTRIGWSKMEALPIISGAFGAFRTEYIAELDGFDSQSIGEDMELTMRIHINNKNKKENKKIIYDPYAVIWTDAPSDLRSFKNQRSRWHKGLMYNILKHKGVILNPSKYKRFWFVYLYLFLEWISPVMEAIGALLLVLMVLFIGINASVFNLILIFGIGYYLAILFSTISIIYQHNHYSMYDRRNILKMLGIALVEPVTYHFIVVGCNIHGIYKYLRGDTSWGTIKRQKFIK